MENLYERIASICKENNVSVTKMCKEARVTRSCLSELQAGRTKNLSSDKLQKIADYFGISVDYLLGKNNNSIFSIPNIRPINDNKKVPRLGTIACGEPVLAEQNIIGYDLIDEEVKCDFTLVCKGDSMINARIFDGDIVYVRQQSDVDNGEIAVVLIENEATLKKVYKYLNKIVLRPCNPLYDDFVYVGEEMKNIRILGKAVMFKSYVRNSK